MLKIAPIIVAGLPISSKLNAPTLADYSKKILEGLIIQDVKAVSYACDGTEVECAVQQILIEQAPSKIKVMIVLPDPGLEPVQIIIAVIKGQPVVMIQDSKHACKTFCNNLFSGTCFLVLGNYITTYSQIHNLLQYCDIKKLDHQDDNAVICLFSVSVLKHVWDKHPNRVGLIVYLFVFGELIDAYQNCQITHHEHVKLALHAHYFLDSWLSFLAASGYSKTQYTISHEAINITHILIEGHLSLIVIHHDQFPGTPLLPWLHSMEACEHCFGMSHQLVADFTYLDWVFMIPKLHVTLCKVILNDIGDSRPPSNGYCHTYFDVAGLDKTNLSSFPSDAKISKIAKQAANETESLLRLLGISHNCLYNLSKGPTLPTIWLWLPAQLLVETQDLEETSHDSADFSDSDSESDKEDTGPSADVDELQDLLDSDQNTVASWSAWQEQEIMNLTYASFTITANKMMKMYTAFFHLHQN